MQHLKTYIESQIFFATTIVGFCAVGIEVNGKRLGSHSLEIQVLSHEFLFEVIHLITTVSLLCVHPVFDFQNGILTVNDFFVNAFSQTTLSSKAVRDLLVYPIDQIDKLNHNHEAYSVVATAWRPTNLSIQFDILFHKYVKFDLND